MDGAGTVSYTHLDVYKRQVKEYAEQGYTHAVAMDLSKYFDTLNHEILLYISAQNI